MLRNIQKYTTVGVQRVMGDSNWRIPSDELENFLDVIVGRGVIGGRTLLIRSQSNRWWGFLAKLCLDTAF